MQIKAQKSSDTNTSPKLHRRQFRKSMFVAPKRQRKNMHENVSNDKFKDANTISEDEHDIKIRTKPFTELGKIVKQNVGINRFRKEDADIKDSDKPDQRQSRLGRQKGKDAISLLNQIPIIRNSDIISNQESMKNTKQDRRDFTNDIRSQGIISKVIG